MICRRCGMESSTTDSCEWCKKPMLPPGGAISAKAKEELLKAKEEGAQAQAAPEVASPERAETEEEAVIRRPESKPPAQPEVHASGLQYLGASLSEGTEAEAPSGTPNYVSGQESGNDELLRPLGAFGTAAQGGDAKDSPIYIGNEEDVLRPIERPAGKDGTRYFVDGAGRKRRVVDDRPEIPDKVRLFRGAIRGSIVAMAMAIIQYFVNNPHQVPSSCVVLPIGNPQSIVGALQFGAYSALLLGFMLSAMMVNFKFGPVVGFLLGFPLGWTLVSMSGAPSMVWPLATGVLCGVVVGKASVTGLKRVVTV